MTSQSPRIYTYKITFEEVPYYYYGVHKEKKFNEYYMGSPITNKWCWGLYTSKKQILQFFDFTDEGYIEAQEVEKRLIKPFYNTDKWCLNENCGGFISLNINRKTGQNQYKECKGIHAETTEQRRKRGQILYRNGKGIHSQTFEERSELGKRNGQKLYKERKGIHAQTFEEHSEKGKKLRDEGKGIFSLTTEEKRQIVKKNYEEKKGIFSLTSKQMSETGKKVASQKWVCLETGFITNAGNLTQYQRARGIDTSKRVRIE
jgi:hypothetical protein